MVCEMPMFSCNEYLSAAFQERKKNYQLQTRYWAPKEMNFLAKYKPIKALQHTVPNFFLNVITQEKNKQQKNIFNYLLF